MAKLNKTRQFTMIIILCVAIVALILSIQAFQLSHSTNDTSGSIVIEDGVSTYVIPTNSFALTLDNTDSISFTAIPSSTNKQLRYQNAEQTNDSLEIVAENIICPGSLEMAKDINIGGTFNNGIVSISEGLISGTELTDGVATLTDGILSNVNIINSNVLTDGIATLTDGILSNVNIVNSSVLTDGIATLTQGVLTGVSSLNSGSIEYDTKDFNISTTVINSDNIAKSYPVTTSVPVDEAYEGNPIIHEDLNEIYFPPFAQGDQSTWHKIKRSNGRLSQYTAGINGKNEAYSGGAYHSELKRLYFCPYSQLNSVDNVSHYVDSKGLVQSYTITPILSTTAYRGAAYIPSSQRIIFAPFGNSSSANWHYIDENGDMQTYAHNSTVVANAYWGATFVENAVLGDRVYFTPYAQSDQSQWHYYDVSENKIVAYDVPQMSEQPQFEAYRGDGIFASDINRLYFAPSTNTVVNSSYYNYIDTVTGLVGEYFIEEKVKNIIISSVSGSYAPNTNRIYFATKKKSLDGDWFYLDLDDERIKSYNAPEKLQDQDFQYSGCIYDTTLSRIYLTPFHQADVLLGQNWHYINDNLKTINTSGDSSEVSLLHNDVIIDNTTINQTLDTNIAIINNRLIMKDGFTNYFKFPKLTTAERDSIPNPEDAIVIFNDSMSKLQIYIGSSWVDLH
jgi:hypothetical protein